MARYSVDRRRTDFPHRPAEHIERRWRPLIWHCRASCQHAFPLWPFTPREGRGPVRWPPRPRRSPLDELRYFQSTSWCLLEWDPQRRVKWRWRRPVPNGMPLLPPFRLAQQPTPTMPGTHEGRGVDADAVTGMHHGTPCAARTHRGAHHHLAELPWKF